MDFKHLLNNTIKELSLVRKHGGSMAKTLRLAKNAAYLAAKNYHELRKNYANDFLDFCNGDIEAWVNREFAPIRQFLLDDPWTLIKAVGEGMTRAQYMTGLPGILTGGRCSTRRGKRVKTELPDIEKAIPATMDLEQRLELVTSLYKTAQAENRELKQKCARLERALKALA